MSLLLTHQRRTMTCFLVLGILLLANPPTRGQDSPDAKAVLEKVKDGPGFQKVRERLAVDPAGARFRLDGFSVGENNSLLVQGVMLVPGAEDADRAAAEKAVRDRVIAVVQEVAGSRDFKDFDFSEAVRYVRSERLPHLQLQKAANEAGKTDPAVDQLQLTDARFDAAGRLIISGRIGPDPRTRNWLTEAAKTTLAGHPAAQDRTGKPLTPIFDLTPSAPGGVWPLTPATLQRALVAADNPALSRIRVERAFLEASPARADEANPAGVNWKYVLSGIVLGTSRPDPKAIMAVVNRVLTEAKWPAIKDGDLEGLITADNRVPDPGPRLQRVIATNPSLDGVRLDARTEFSPDGRLVLAGVQPGLDSKRLAELATLARQTLELLAAGNDGNQHYLKLAAAGISTDKLQRVRVRELHSELRQWVAANFNDVRLGRLYFDADGILTLTCEAADPAVKETVEKELAARAARLIPPAPPPVETERSRDEPKEGEPKKELQDPILPQAPTAVARFISPTANIALDEPKSPATGPVVRFTPLKASLTKYLQQVVSDPKNKEWEALLIERGYFDADNRYTIRGVAESEEQKQRFTEFLSSLADDPLWGAYFRPYPPASPDLEVIPMNRLVGQLRRVMPAYEVFDGIRLTRGRYVFSEGSGDPTLVFDAQVVGRPDPAAPARLRDLIAEDKKYFGRRLPQGRPIQIRAGPPEIPSSDELGEFSVGYGALALSRGDLPRAKAWIDAALLHYPHDPAVWFLSAYYNLVIGDVELARRDLYRLIELEGRLDFDGPALRKRRYAAAKDLQGDKRNELERLWLTCWREVKDGVAKPLKLAPSK